MATKAIDMCTQYQANQKKKLKLLEISKIEITGDMGTLSLPKTLQELSLRLICYFKTFLILSTKILAQNSNADSQLNAQVICSISLFTK